MPLSSVLSTRSSRSWKRRSTECSCEVKSFRKFFALAGEGETREPSCRSSSPSSMRSPGRGFAKNVDGFLIDADPGESDAADPDKRATPWDWEYQYWAHAISGDEVVLMDLLSEGAACGQVPHLREGGGGL